MIAPVNKLPSLTKTNFENDIIHLNNTLNSFEKKYPCPENANELLDCIQFWTTWTKQFSKEATKEARMHLKRHTIAICYRAGIYQRKAAISKHFETLKKLAKEWKSQDPFYTNKELEPHEISPLVEVAHYKKFAKFLTKWTEISKNFFNFSLKNQNTVAPFIEFPFHVTFLKKCYLHCRLGRYVTKYLYVTEKPKDLKIVINHRSYSLLNLNQTITFPNWNPTLKEILAQFENDNITPSKLEVAIGGINSMCYHYFAFWDQTKNKFDPIDTLSKLWWQNPAIKIQALASAQELASYYQLEFNKGDWLFVISSSRTHCCLDIDGSHAYVAVWIPLSDGNYRLYSFGKYPKIHVQQEEWRNYLTDTRLAVIAYESLANTRRQIANYPHVITESEGHRIMQKIGVDIQKGRDDKLVVQLGTWTCARWASDLATECLDQKIPDVFKSHILDSETFRDPLKTAIGLVRKMPDTMKPHLIWTVATALGWERGITIVVNGEKVFISLKTSEFSTNGYYVSAPARLHRNMEEGKIKGFLDYGHRPFYGIEHKVQKAKL